MKSSNLLFIQKFLTESSFYCHESLPYLTITSVMMFLSDNSISLADTFSCLTSDTRGLFNAIDLEDIRRISNSIYSFSLDGDYKSAHLLNPLGNTPQDYAALYHKTNSCDFFLDALASISNINLSISEIGNDINNVVEPEYKIGRLVFATDLLKALPAYIVAIKDNALHDLDTVILKGLLKHPVFVCELPDGTYEIYICTHSIPSGMSSDHFEFIGFDSDVIDNNMKYNKNNSITRYISKFKYKIPKYCIKEIDETDISDNLRSFRDILIEHSEEERGALEPKLLYLNKGSNLVSPNGILKLNYESTSKEILYTYKHIYKEVGIEPNKVWFSNTNYINGYNKNWLSK